MNNSAEINLETTVPQAWVNQLETLAQQKDSSVSQLIRAALAQYLGIEDVHSVPNFSLKEYKSELRELKTKITELEAYRYQVKEMNIRLSVMEQNITKLQRQNIGIHHSFSSEAMILDATLDYDDDDYYEDEPDEILTEFIPPNHIS
jgi:hypothetical protein